jgi:hypothetical protein
MSYKDMINLRVLLIIAGSMFLAILCAASSSDSIKALPSLDKINQACRAGKITEGQKLLYGLQTLLAPRDLPDEFKSEAVPLQACGTPLVFDVLDNWDKMTEAQQSLATSYLARPPLDSLYISPDSHFAIHFNIVGYDSVPTEDADLSGVPDYVERIGIYADSSYRHYHYNLGYLPPPSDGDSFYDIYLMRVGNYYGATVREWGGDSSWNDYVSHIRIHSTMFFAPPNDDPEGTVIGAQKITCAHEYFHATQMAYAYKNRPHLWWTEGNAAFFENEVYDEVNDHYSYLPYFFNFPDSFLIDTSTAAIYRNYGALIWSAFLAERVGVGIIRTAWEYIRYTDPLPALDSSLAPHGLNVQKIFPEFTVWNYFTGERADPLYYDDAADYPQVVIDHYIPACPFTGDTGVKPPDGLATNYIVAYPDNIENGLLKIEFDGINSVEWGFSYIVFENGLSHAAFNCPVNAFGETDCGIYDFVRYDSIVFIPCVVSQWQDDNQYTFDSEVYSVGDVNGSGDRNLLDITFLINFVYKSGLPPRYSSYMGDTDCNGVINILDITRLIGFIYLGGPEPCVFSP